MKTKRLLALLCLVVLSVSLACPALADAAIEPWWDSSYDVDYYVYIVSGDGRGLQLHDGPGSNYWAYDQIIPDGTRVHIARECTSNYGNKWGYVDDNGYWGWIYLHDTASSPVETWDVDYTAWILTDDGTGLNIRSGPDTRFDKIDGLIPEGTQLHVLKEGRLGKGKTWGYVEYHNGKRGWLTLTFVTKTPPAVVPVATPAPVDFGAADGSVPAADIPVSDSVEVDPGIGRVEPDDSTQQPGSSPIFAPVSPEEGPARETSSGNSELILMLVILGVSIFCLVLAACLLVVTIKKRKDRR